MSGGPSTSTSTGPSTTTTTIPAQDPSAGCSANGAPVGAGETVRSLTTAGVAHPYLLSIPTGYRPARPTPLVLSFHGYASNAREFAALTQMPTEGARRDVIVVTPEGPNHTWQLNATGSDAAFVDAIVATVAKSVCVDMHRVYASGFSQGAAFTIIYSCARQNRIAAFATVAVDFQLGCEQPVPYLAFHGTVDPLVPYDNGGIGASIPGKVRGTLLNMGDWARLDKCGAVPTVHTFSYEIVLRTWPQCTGATSVELYTIIKGSHTWPGANPKASPLYTTRQIDATALMLAFFGLHHLPGS